MQMKQMKRIALFLLLMGLLFFGVKSYQYAILFEQNTQKLVSYQDIEGQANRQMDNFAKSILGSLYTADEVDLQPLIKTQQESMKSARKYTTYFMSLLLIIMLTYFWTSLQVFTIVGSLAVVVTLILGLITPILMITIHKEIGMIGDVVLSFESKSVAGSIQKLWSSSDKVVAIVLFLFSAGVPIVKVLSLLFVSVYTQNKYASKVVTFFKMIGKWSMVDVFVVAVFLVYLTAGNSGVSRAEVEVGLYFFLAYVIASMLVSLSADKMLKETSK
jgi:hypothetical protein